MRSQAFRVGGGMSISAMRYDARHIRAERKLRGPSAEVATGMRASRIGLAKDVNEVSETSRGVKHIASLHACIHAKVCRVEGRKIDHFD